MRAGDLVRRYNDPRRGDWYNLPDLPVLDTVGTPTIIGISLVIQVHPRKTTKDFGEPVLQDLLRDFHLASRSCTLLLPDGEMRIFFESFLEVICEGG